MLRRLRIALSTIVAILVLLTFIAGSTISTVLADKVLLLQFTPSLLSFVFTGAIVAFVGLTVILCLTLFFGRVYCASLCPLGILQDLLIFLRRRLLGKKKYQYHRPFNILRYSVLFLTLFCAITGSLILVNLLDPFSLFGRMTVDLLLPLMTYTTNTIITAAERFDLFFSWPLTLHSLALPVFCYSLVVFIILVVISFSHGRFYCNSICPVGSLLGLLSRFSHFKICNEEDKCNGCGVCETVCRAECIDSSSKTVDPTRCVACFDCLSVCPTEAVSFRANKASPQPLEPSRRRFILSTGCAGGLLALVGLPLRKKGLPLLPNQFETPITPPGSRSVRHFTDVCIACHLCVRTCPSKIIQPSLLEYGLTGVMQPVISYKHGHCEYECNLCSQVCPTDAISPIELEEKKLSQIGEVQFLKERCVVEVKGKDCGACAEVCPTRAVRMVLKEELYFPETHPEYCIGCGHCEFACPTDPKAIFVKGHRIHRRAKEPASGPAPFQASPTSDEDYEFPF